MAGVGWPGPAPEKKTWGTTEIPGRGHVALTATPGGTQSPTPHLVPERDKRDIRDIVPTCPGTDGTGGL